jgi:hypothetical protein
VSRGFTLVVLGASGTGSRRLFLPRWLLITLMVGVLAGLGASVWAGFAAHEQRNERAETRSGG